MRRRFNYTWTSVYSRQLHNDSKWTAAVGDVGRGAADLALSDFWVTTERAALVEFTAPIGSYAIELWVKLPEDHSGHLTWDKVTRVSAFDLCSVALSAV